MTRVLWLCLIAACGYTAGFRPTQPRLEDGSVPAVAIVPFDNRTYRRGLEMDLTRLVADEVRARSPRAASDPATADWILTGEVTRAEERILSEDRGDVVRESSFEITVKVVLRERATEKVIRTYSFTEREPFSLRAGRIATLEEARRQVLRDLAEDIAYWLESQNPTS